MATLHFRNFCHEDADQVYRTALASWHRTYRNIFDDEFIEEFVGKHYSREMLLRFLPQIASGTTFFQVAIDEPHVVGFCQISNRSNGMELTRIYVAPTRFGEGIGGSLLLLGEDYLRTNGASSYFCYVHSRNEIGKNFYRKQGFIHVSEKNDDDHWYMEKQLY